MTKTAHAGHCFVAIPSGRPGEEREFFEGWRNEVILPALNAFEPHVVAATDAPTSITFDIFEHLLFDPVAVFDLGGSVADAPANPNVMYELGIRHAFRLPSVILAWEQQPLPFDINDQRAVKIDRKAFRFKEAREKIEAFVINAANGKFYDPLESLANRAILERAGKSDNALQAIAEELANLTQKVEGLREGLSTSSGVGVIYEPFYKEGGFRGMGGTRTLKELMNFAREKSTKDSDAS